MDEYTAAFATASTVYISNYFFNMSLDEIEKYLRHEITHCIMISYFGSSECFLFSEGIAVFIENEKTIPESSPYEDRMIIEEIIGMSYYYYFMNIQGNMELIMKYYQLSGEFVGFWCNTFGIENYFSLYKKINILNYKQIIQKYSQIPFNEIINNYMLY